MKTKLYSLIIFLMFTAVSVYAFPIPDTGITKCYDDSKEIPCPKEGEPFYGQDGNYSINPMSYTKLDDNGNDLPITATSWAMVRDNVTGLIWENNSYQSTWDNAPNIIAELNTAKFGGYSDWRLPTMTELGSIVDYSIPYPGPTINTTYFKYRFSSYYWSSSTHANYISYAWGVPFNDSYDYYLYKNLYRFHVRAVRAGQSVIRSFDPLVINGDRIVSDNTTGLMWQQDTAKTATGATAMVWKDALSYCENLTIGGYTDWRLPTLKELRSIVDYTVESPAIDTSMFKDTFASSYSCWSSSTHATSILNAWFMSFYDGRANNGNKSNAGYVRAVRGGQSVIVGNLAIAQQPMSAPAGTTFVQWGTGFTPNSTATLHFKKPDGTEYPTTPQPIDAIGHFEIKYTAASDKPDGEYTWWAVDGVKGWKSNEVKYTIDSTQEISAHISWVTNTRTISNQFEIWLDVSINNQAPGENFLNQYKIEINGDKRLYVSIDSGVCEYRGDGELNAGKSSRYRQFFQIVGFSGSSPAYFENGQVTITSKTTGKSFLIKDLKNFSVYGTNFDIKKDAWSFKNASWKNAKPFTDITKAANYIEKYIPKSKTNDFWSGIGYFGFVNIIKDALDNPFIEIKSDLDSAGLCYGLANASIANFNHSGNAWGTGDILQWNQDIIDHWSKDKDIAIESPKGSFTFKPFDDQLINLTWNFNTAKKIMYYYVGQAFYAGGELWVGDDGERRNTPINSPDVPITILKNGSPISFGFSLQGGGGHRIAATQLITYNDIHAYILWDNNCPYPKNLSEEEYAATKPYAPYLRWEVGINKNKLYGLSRESDRTICYIRKIHPLNGQPLYTLDGLPGLLPPTDDPQNIYRMGATNRNKRNLVERSLDSSVDSISSDLPENINVSVIGGQITAVTNKATGEQITLIPNGDASSGQAAITTTMGGSYNLLQLPPETTYRIDAVKMADMPFLKVFVRVPEADGTLQAVNYDAAETGESDATQVYFYVGRGNTDKAIRRSVVSSQASSLTKAGTQRTTDNYNPDYDENLITKINPPSDLKAILESNAVQLSWVNTNHPNLSGVKIVRTTETYPTSPDDGVTVYDSTGTDIEDSSISIGTTYYYAAYSKDTSGNYSEPEQAVVDTYLFSIYGKVALSTGEGVTGAVLTLQDESGQSVGQTFSGSDGTYQFSNLEMNNYVVTVSHSSYSIQNGEKDILLSDHNVEENFTATPIPSLSLLFNMSSVDIGTTVSIPWSYRNISDTQTVKVELYREGAWQTLSANAPILAGQIQWSVAGSPEPDVQLKISLNGDSSVIAEHSFEIKSPVVSELQNVVLTDSSPSLNISSGENIKVYGSSGVNTLNISSGAKVECINFPGANVINIVQDSPSDFTVHRSGATVYFESATKGTTLKMPATKTTQTINFNGGVSYNLVISSGKVMLNSQEITTAKVQL